jgi:hypothetical protein
MAFSSLSSAFLDKTTVQVSHKLFSLMALINLNFGLSRTFSSRSTLAIFALKNLHIHHNGPHVCCSRWYLGAFAVCGLIPVLSFMEPGRYIVSLVSVKNLLPSIEPAPIHHSLSCHSGPAHRSTGRRPCYQCV